YEYSILNFGEKIADDYFTSLHDTFELLAEQPELGRKFHEFRRHEHAEHIFFYKITGYGIKIIHILHQKENIHSKIH
ncbi:type II toxin-antitoxin system RelE/ParE family toxin, partial [Sulfurimonas sp. MAG313]